MFCHYSGTSMGPEIPNAKTKRIKPHRKLKRQRNLAANLRCFETSSMPVKSETAVNNFARHSAPKQITAVWSAKMTQARKSCRKPGDRPRSKNKSSDRMFTDTARLLFGKVDSE